jgi:O-antigen/teichoic acid export membrane protein
MAVVQAFLPRLCNDIEGRAGQTGQVFRVLALVNVVAMAAIALAAYPAIYLIAGKEFLDCIPTFLVLLVGISLFGSSRVLGAYLWAHKKQAYTMVNNWYGVLATLLLCGLVIPRWGLIGAAGAASVGRIVLLALTIFAYRRVAADSADKLMPRGPDIRYLVRSTRDITLSVASRRPRRSL